MKLPHKLLTLLIFILVGCRNAPVVALPSSAPTQKNGVFKNTVVSLTFDDGDADNYSVRAILAKNNLRATFYIISGLTGSAGYMTAQQLRDLYGDGNEIGGHTLNHVNLTTVRGATLKREVCQNRMDLLAYGFRVTSFAYPFGHYNEEAKQVVKDCGYSNARAVMGGPVAIPPADVYALPAMPYIVKDASFLKMTRYATQTEDGGGGWVIFVFHHVCDNCGHYATDLKTFTRFAQWLGERQTNGLVVKTVGEVIGK